MYKTLAAYPDPIEAHIVCGRLRAQGLHAHVADHHTATGNWYWRLAIGGAKVRVPLRQFEQGRRMLEALDRGDFAIVPAAAAHAPAAAPPYRESRSSRIAYLGLCLGIPWPWRRRCPD